MASGEDSYLCTRCVALSAVNDFNQESEQKDKKAEQKVVDGELQQKRGVKTQIVIIAVCMLIMTVQFFRIFSDDILQIGHIVYPAGSSIVPHVHRNIERMIEDAEKLGENNG